MHIGSGIAYYDGGTYPQHYNYSRLGVRFAMKPGDKIVFLMKTTAGGVISCNFSLRFASND